MGVPVIIVSVNYEFFLIIPPYFFLFKTIYWTKLNRPKPYITFNFWNWRIKKWNKQANKQNKNKNRNQKKPTNQKHKTKYNKSDTPISGSEVCMDLDVF